MRPELWRRVRAAFEQALDVPAAQRDALLDQLLGDDRSARAEVVRLLALEPQAKDYLAPVGAATLADVEPAGAFGPRVDDRVGPYRLVRVLGSGGMGTVFAARGELPRREVAVKVMRVGATSERARRRFQHEIDLSARLQHPGIAAVYDAGLSCGQPWFAMELLAEARPITTYARGNALPVPARIALLLDVCAAVQHAHQHGVIHRDLKPANVLVDRHGRAKVIDFGIACSLGADRERLTQDVTGQHDLLGTLLYMSPERLLHSNAAADVRSDVYGLGVILFELLTDRPPFDLDGQSLPAACRLLLDVEAPPPSRIASSLPRELDWIVQRALAKDRDHRYGSVADFAADLQRLRQHEPVLAAPPGSGYRLRKFARRHRSAVAAGVVVVATTAIAFAATATALVRTQRAEANERLGRAAASASAERAEAALGFLLDVFSTAAPGATSAGKDVTMGQGLDRAARDFDARFAAQPLIHSPLARTIGRAYLGLGDLDSAERHLRRALTTLPADLPGQDVQRTELHLDLADLERMRGRLPEARTELTTAAATAASLPAAHRTNLRLRTRRGEQELAEGDKNAAAATLRAVVDDLRSAFGVGDPDTLFAQNQFAGALHALGDLDQAEQNYRAAVQGLTACKGSDHPSTLSAMSNLALVLFSRRPSHDGVATLEHVLEVRRRVLGPDHDETLEVLTNLGAQHYMLGEPDRALELWQEAVARLASKMPAEHPVLQTLRMNMATIERDRGHFARAVELADDVLASRRKTLGAAHEKTLVALTFVADARRQAGDLERAAAQFDEALALARGCTPPDLPNIYRCQLGAGRVAMARRDFAAAEAAFLACRDGYTAATAMLAVKSMLGRAEGELAALYAAWDKPEAAARYRAIVAAKDYREYAGTAK